MRRRGAHGKPAPDIYLRAAELLGLEPAHCLAIEDSVTGTAAAEDAGCPVLVVPNEVEVPVTPRRRHVSSLTQVGIPQLREIYAELQLGLASAQPEAAGQYRPVGGLTVGR